MTEICTDAQRDKPTDLPTYRDIHTLTSMRTYATGIRRADLKFEYDALQLLQPLVRERPAFVAECLHKVWDVVGYPMKLLEQADKGPDGLVNASQVLDGFAWLAAGGRKHDQPEDACKPMMINHQHADEKATESHRTSAKRVLELKQWFKAHRIRYILNLAGDDANMGEYPLDKDELVQVRGTDAKGDAFDVGDETDDDNDDRTHVLILPMKDANEYDLRSCKYLAAAGVLESSGLEYCSTQLPGRLSEGEGERG